MDSCVWGPTRQALQAKGHDVSWVGDWERDPGDQQILIRAHAEHRILITLDKDFGELAVVHGIPHSGIVRIIGLGAREQAQACLQVLALHGEELLGGAVVTVGPGRLRVRAGERGKS
jgi:predicted nuclease of predicted toxin-antitoxin system